MLTIYTAVYGKTYRLLPPEVRAPHLRYLCFTDDPANSAEGVETIIVPPVSEIPELAAKWHKWHPPEGPTLYLDSAYQLLSDPSPWMKCLTCDLGLCAHALRTCCYYEAKVIEKYRRWEGDKIRHQVWRYHRQKFPENFGLWEGGIIFRTPSKLVESFNVMVWEEICAGSIRDQLTIPYCLWSLGLRCDTLPSRMPDMVRQHRSLL